jgi:hypothetical protein
MGENCQAFYINWLAEQVDGSVTIIGNFDCVLLEFPLNAFAVPIVDFHCDNGFTFVPPAAVCPSFTH